MRTRICIPHSSYSRLCSVTEHRLFLGHAGDGNSTLVPDIKLYIKPPDSIRLWLVLTGCKCSWQYRGVGGCGSLRF